MPLISRSPDRISRSYPSFCNRFRSGLRLISWCDIEDHPLLYLDLASRHQTAHRIGVRAVFVADSEQNVRSRGRRRERQCHELLEGHRLAGQHLLLPIDVDSVGLGRAAVKVLVVSQMDDFRAVVDWLVLTVADHLPVQLEICSHLGEGIESRARRGVRRLVPVLVNVNAHLVLVLVSCFGFHRHAYRPLLSVSLPNSFPSHTGATASNGRLPLFRRARTDLPRYWGTI